MTTKKYSLFCLNWVKYFVKRPIYSPNNFHLLISNMKWMDTFFYYFLQLFFVILPKVQSCPVHEMCFPLKRIGLFCLTREKRSIHLLSIQYLNRSFWRQHFRDVRPPDGAVFIICLFQFILIDLMSKRNLLLFLSSNGVKSKEKRTAVDVPARASAMKRPPSVLSELWVISLHSLFNRTVESGAKIFRLWSRRHRLWCFFSCWRQVDLITSLNIKDAVKAMRRQSNRWSRNKVRYKYRVEKHPTEL